MTEEQRKGVNDAHLRNLPWAFRQKIRAILTALEGWGWRPRINESVRSPERQRQLFDQGYTKTMKSMHLAQADGYAHAVDVVCDGVEWNDSSPAFVPYRIMQGHLAKGRPGVRWGGTWTSFGKWGDWAHLEYQP